MNDPNCADVYLPAGQFHFGGGPLRVHTLLGTCVAIMLWHPAKRIGGMCHYLLPERMANAPKDGAGPGLYADDVMGLIAGALHGSQTRAEEYVVKIAGGGNMFPEHLVDRACRADACTAARRATCQSIGCKNSSAGRTLLYAAGFTISAENLGGHGSRQVIFDLSCGDVWIKRGAPISSGTSVAA
jgi:chemotaxis protein CheD